jgi:hypothetical protein
MKLFSNRIKILTSLITATLILLTVSSTLGVSFTRLDLGNNNYLSFGENDTVSIPHQGVYLDNAIIGYWKMNEGYGVTTNDSSNNQKGSYVSGASWVGGKYGTALSFDGFDDSLNMSLVTINHNAGAISLWVYSNINFSSNYGKEGQIIGQTGNQYMGYLGLKESESNYTLIGETNKNEEYFVAASNVIPKGTWNQIIVNFLDGVAYTYVNGLQVDQKAGLTNDLSFNVIGLASPSTAFCGIVDEVTVYNRSLAISEIKGLRSLGEQPDPCLFATFYNITNLVTGETMLMKIEKSNDNNSFTEVKVLSFFSNDVLLLESNDSMTLNIWTNLGKPNSVINGVWNSENYTTTLHLDSSSNAQLDWSIGIPPSASNPSISSTIANENTVFSTFWTDNKSLSGGGYIFSSNNSGLWVNSSWTPFNLNPGWGNFSLTLNSTVGITIGFREFANDSLGLWGDSRIYCTTIIKNNSSSTPSPSPTNASLPTLKPTLTPIPTSSPSPNPSTQKTTPALTTGTTFSMQAFLTLALVVAGLVVFLVSALIKGYISIEIETEEKVTGIMKRTAGEVGSKEYQDYSI